MKFLVDEEKNTHYIRINVKTTRLYKILLFPPFTSKMNSELGSGRDTIEITADLLSVDEAVKAVTSPTSGAISLFIGKQISKLLSKFTIL